MRPGRRIDGVGESSEDDDVSHHDRFGMHAKTLDRMAFPGTARRHHYVSRAGIIGRTLAPDTSGELRVVSTTTARPSLCGEWSDEWVSAPASSAPCMTCHALACAEPNAVRLAQ